MVCDGDGLFKRHNKSNQFNPEVDELHFRSIRSGIDLLGLVYQSLF